VDAGEEAAAAAGGGATLGSAVGALGASTAARSLSRTAVFGRVSPRPAETGRVSRGAAREGVTMPEDGCGPATADGVRVAGASGCDGAAPVDREAPAGAVPVTTMPIGRTWSATTSVAVSRVRPTVGWTVVPTVSTLRCTTGATTAPTVSTLRCTTGAMTAPTVSTLRCTTGATVASTVSTLRCTTAVTGSVALATGSTAVVTGSVAWVTGSTAFATGSVAFATGSVTWATTGSAAFATGSAA
jgi:hypothetical protein